MLNGGKMLHSRKSLKINRNTDIKWFRTKQRNSV